MSSTFAIQPLPFSISPSHAFNYPARSRARLALPALVSILLLAATLRIINADHFAVWTDEGWSTWAVSDHQLTTILGKVAADRHPPGYFLALSGWESLAGDSRIALRFLSIAAGLLIVAVTYRIGVEWFGRLTGIYAALLIAVLPSSIYYAQEIRNYAWLTLATLLMTLFVLRSLHKPRRSTLIAYALSTTFMLYTLYIGVFVLIVHGAIGLLVWRGSIKQKAGLIGAWLLAIVLYVPWLSVLFNQVQHLSNGVVSDPTTLDGLRHVVQDLLSPHYALIGGLVLIGSWQVVSQAMSRQWLPRLIILWSSVGLFGIMALANLRVGTLSNHTVAFLLPAFALIGGCGLAALARSARLALIGVTLISVIGAPGVVQPRLDYLTAAQAVAADYSPGDLIVLETGWDDDAFRYELIHALGDSAAGSILTTLAWVNNYTPNVPVVPQIEPQIAGTRRVWVINWLQPAQLMPFLDKSGDSFSPLITRQTSVGSQYAAIYPDPTVREVLYMRPPSIVARRYSDLFTLDSTLVSDTAQPGHDLHVDLWWTATQPPPHDYSIGVFLLNAQGISAAQQDSPPGTTPTTSWLSGVQHADRHTLRLPATLAPGTYSIAIAVYWYGDGKRLPVTGPGSTAAQLAIIGHIQVS